MTRTEETASEAGLRELLDIEADEDVPDRIETHDGDWVREGLYWVFFQHEGIFE